MAKHARTHVCTHASRNNNNNKRLFNFRINACRRSAERLTKEAAAVSRRVMGDAHADTRHYISGATQCAIVTRRTLAPMHLKAQQVLAIGRGFGLTEASGLAHLNGRQACVLGCGGRPANSRSYRCRAIGSWSTDDQPLLILLENFVLTDGTAVRIQGLTNGTEWNGHRGVVQSFDPDAGRYSVTVTQRKRALALRRHCCVVEAAITAAEPVPVEDATQLPRARLCADEGAATKPAAAAAAGPAPAAGPGAAEAGSAPAPASGPSTHARLHTLLVLHCNPTLRCVVRSRLQLPAAAVASPPAGTARVAAA